MRAIVVDKTTTDDVRGTLKSVLVGDEYFDPKAPPEIASRTFEWEKGDTVTVEVIVRRRCKKGLVKDRWSSEEEDVTDCANDGVAATFDRMCDEHLYEVIYVMGEGRHPGADTYQKI